MRAFTRRWRHWPCTNPRTSDQAPY